MLDAAVMWSAVKQPREGAEGAYGVFAAADGARIAVSVLEEAMWERLCGAFGWTDWLEDPAMSDPDARRRRAPEVAARLADEIARRPADELAELAVRHDVAMTRVNAVGDVPRDPQIVARDLFPDAAYWRPLGPAAPAVRLDQPTGAV
jgi:crotonobetainyl-CoA:carnitine CoA-transferase CaiB-like acyl-CoA transferase